MDIYDRHQPIDNTITNNYLKLVDKLSLSNILSVNPYDWLVLCDLWYIVDKLQIKCLEQNGQKIRSRWYGDCLLTPIVDLNGRLPKLPARYIEILPLYQPYYPETYYKAWEIFHQNIISTDNNLFMCTDDQFGWIESLTIYNELYHITHTKFKYYCNKISEYLDQTFNIDKMNPSVHYGLVIIDTIRKLPHINLTTNLNEDIACLLYYMFNIFPFLETGGQLIINLSFIMGDQWLFILDILFNKFSSCKIVRYQSVNPLDPSVCVIASQYHGIKLTSVERAVYGTYYRQKMYDNFDIVYNKQTRNLLRDDWHKIKTEWYKNIEQTVVNNKNQVRQQIEWATTYNISIINKPDITKNDLIVGVLPTTSQQIDIKQIKCNIDLEDIKLSEGRLIVTKRVIDTKPIKINGNLLSWNQIKYELDKNKYVRNYLKRKYNCKMITNAWVKLYEIYSIFPDLLGTKPTVTTFHICEAPGAFISATQYWLADRNRKFDWYAQSLNPVYNKSALTDHWGLIADYPDRWLFGNPDTGDITNIDVIKSYASLAIKFDFMTADAGIHCDSKTYNKQEQLMCKINLGQIVCILACLSIGGNAVVKTFLPMTCPLTISLVYIMSTYFNSVSIVKSDSSRNTNSEIYLVLSGYISIDQVQLTKLYNIMADDTISHDSWICQPDEMFMSSYRSTINDLIDKQIVALKQAYYYYYNWPELIKLRKSPNYYVKSWNELYG